ncbi:MULTISPECIES: UPF0104 family protein [Methanothermobacter]|uniref:UPF0104 family protein n=1 Tax=Methanothermobacter wolfeii TaxID=145261 RepID=A0A9E7UN28_METWO|nr:MULTISPECIES: UPF0104 family protein [Methanothermobacter]QHN06987.1 UPF0104 family protein [Methanothermobacter sp. THM-1]UXH31581.1 UPF0104 family protein [Methanothermobacter wolfeii]
MKHKGIILIIIGVAALAGMIIFIGPGEIEGALQRADLLYVIMAVILEFLILWLLTLRWSITTRAVSIDVRKRHLFPMLLVGMAINNLTPSARGGGEPVRAYMLGKYSRASMESSFATVIADRGLDTFPFIFLAILTIVGIVLYFNLALWMVALLIVSVVIVVAAFFLALYVSVDRESGERIVNWALGIVKRFYRRNYAKIEARVRGALREFQSTMRIMLADRNVLIYGIPLSFILWFLEILRVYLIFAAFGAPVSILVIAEVFILATLIGMIPLLPGGVGAVDGIMIVFYSAAGVSPSVSAAVTVVERLISFWMVSAMGIAVLPYFGSSVAEKLMDKL